MKITFQDKGRVPGEQALQPAAEPGGEVGRSLERAWRAPPARRVLPFLVFDCDRFACVLLCPRSRPSLPLSTRACCGVWQEEIAASDVAIFFHGVQRTRHVRVWVHRHTAELLGMHKCLRLMCKARTPTEEPLARQSSHRFHSTIAAVTKWRVPTFSCL